MYPESVAATAIGLAALSVTRRFAVMTALEQLPGLERIRIETAH
jgi:hypothetical protein